MFWKLWFPFVVLTDRILGKLFTREQLLRTKTKKITTDNYFMLSKYFFLTTQVSVFFQ